MAVLRSSTARAGIIAVLISIVGIGALAQSQTTGGIAGAVRDQNGALIVGATVILTGKASGEERRATTDATGSFSITFLSPGSFDIQISAPNFRPVLIESATVSINEITEVDGVLEVAGPTSDPVSVGNVPSMIKTETTALGRSFDGQTASDLPLATRNISQLLSFIPGVGAFLVDSTIVGRNSQAIAVNGARVSQNSFQINGVETGFGVVSTRLILTPAPESIAELKIQTSLSDASVGRAGGGSVQAVTRSGGTNFSGSIYDYFSDTVLNANNPFLKAAGQPRPVLERNVFGILFGGPLKRDRAFFFVSYQATRERNGASLFNSLSSGVLIGTTRTPLTDDRSAITLQSQFPGIRIHPISLFLLNARLPTGELLIPTPQTGSRYSGSSVSSFREQQFNANLDFRISSRNFLTAKVFFAHSPQIVARSGASNVPGFPIEQKLNNLVVSIQDLGIINSNVTNEARIGTGLTRINSGPKSPLADTDIGIIRKNASEFPGFPFINVAAASGGLGLGPAGLVYENSKFLDPVFADTVAFTRPSHSIRVGIEIRYYLLNINLPIQTRGNIAFADFPAFLRGTSTQTARLSTGITDRAFRTSDYNLFVQDDWKPAPNLTVNLGLRYELDLPPYDTRGRIGTFDPELYCPPAAPNGPPACGLVQAGNPARSYERNEIPNVGRRVVKSIDANNLAPRLGVAYMPTVGRDVVLRAGYGIYYSRSIFSYLVNNIFHPPFYFSSLASETNLRTPFSPVLPRYDEFPIVPQNAPLFGFSFDRNIRSPYIQQFNAAIQIGLSGNSAFEIAYVGSRGNKLFRQVAINQAALATPGHPINGVATNTPGNATLRTPFRGILPGSGFTQDQTTARSYFDSLQVSIVRRYSRGLQFQISYTLSKSIDNASGGGGGGSTTGITDTQSAGESATIIGNQLDDRANRGLSSFDRRHRFTASGVWLLPKPSVLRRSRFASALFSGWRIAGIVAAMSGIPIDVIDTGAATFYFGQNAGGARPNFVPGRSPSIAVAGYYFNPFAFARPSVIAGQFIPSSNQTAIAGANGVDFGNVGRNVLQGPNQFNVDLSVSRKFKLAESKTLEVRGDAFNLLNTVNLANPISNFNAVIQGGGSIDTMGRITGENAGDFGRIISTSSNPRIIQLGIKFTF